MRKHDDSQRGGQSCTGIERVNLEFYIKKILRKEPIISLITL